MTSDFKFLHFSYQGKQMWQHKAIGLCWQRFKREILRLAIMKDQETQGHVCFQEIKHTHDYKK